MSERYVLTESSGYRIGNGTGQSTSGGRKTEVLVLDSACCYRVVWSSWSSPIPIKRRYFNWDSLRGRKVWRTYYSTRTAYSWPLAKARAYAAELADRLNAEDVAA